MTNEMRFGDIHVVDACYVANSIDPVHHHNFAHVSFILSGEALEVRGTTPIRHRGRTGASQLPGGVHAMYFPVETRVLTIVLPEFLVDERSDVAGLTDVVSQLNSPHEIPEFLRYVLPHFRNRIDMPPWLMASVCTFPWASDVPLREAARKAQVHPSHYARMFTRNVGVSPREFRRRAKLRVAAEHLVTTSAPLTKISLDAGFYDQSHLTAAFSKAFGVPPAFYRSLFAQTS